LRSRYDRRLSSRGRTSRPVGLFHPLARLRRPRLARRDAGGSGRTCPARMLAGPAQAHVRAGNAVHGL